MTFYNIWNFFIENWSTTYWELILFLCNTILLRTVWKILWCFSFGTLQADLRHADSDWQNHKKGYEFDNIENIRQKLTITLSLFLSYTLARWWPFFNRCIISFWCIVHFIFSCNFVSLHRKHKYIRCLVSNCCRRYCQLTPN